MLAPVLASNRAGEKAVFPMIWGYNLLGIRRPVANVRSETAAEKLIFKDGWATHRCVIRALWYPEWAHTVTPTGKSKAGEKYSTVPKEADMTWLCGVYRMENDYPHFVILTRESGESISFIFIGYSALFNNSFSRFQCKRQTRPSFIESRLTFTIPLAISLCVRTFLWVVSIVVTMLTRGLWQLENDRLDFCAVHPIIPPTGVYVLTEHGILALKSSYACKRRNRSLQF